MSRFRDAGLVIAGRTNSPELGSVPTTEPLAWGATHNPWDTSRTPGGSSGGAAAAVASGMVPFAHASDGGGSIRIPASCCGLVGLKPSQGRISLGPVRDETALSVELCVSRTVRDTATLLDAVRGPAIGDTVIAPAPARSYVDELGAEPGRLRIGLLDHHPQGGAVAPECAAAARSVATLLESFGHTVEQAWPKALEDTSLRVHFATLWSTNMGVGLRRFEEQIGRSLTADEFEPVNRMQAEVAAHFTAVDYALAFSAATHFRRSLQAWWADGWDVLLTPTVAELPLPLGTIGNDPDNPLAAMERAFQFIPFTPPFNLSGQPAINVPVEWTDAGLPVGVQLVARLRARRHSAAGGQPTGSRQALGAPHATGLDVAELVDDVFRRRGNGLSVCGPRPQVGAVRVFQLDRRSTDRRRHLVDLGIAKRRNVIQHPGEVVRQTTGIPARERPGDNGVVELGMPQSRPVRLVGSGLVGQQQRGADLGGGRSPAQHTSDVFGGPQPAGGDQRNVVRVADAIEQLGQRLVPGSMSGANVPRCPPAFGPWTTRPSAPAATATPAS